MNGRRFSSLIAAEGRWGTFRETSLSGDERDETSAARRPGNKPFWLVYIIITWGQSYEKIRSLQFQLQLYSNLEVQQNIHWDWPAVSEAIRGRPGTKGLECIQQVSFSLKDIPHTHSGAENPLSIPNQVITKKIASSISMKRLNLKSAFLLQRFNSLALSNLLSLYSIQIWPNPPKARWNESSVFSGYPSGRDGPIQPARDFPRWSREGPSSLFGRGPNRVIETACFDAKVQ